MTERRPIPGRDGYFAGSDGHIYSAFRSREAPLAEGRDRDGYPTVQIVRPGAPGRSSTLGVHCLIARAWLPPRPRHQHEVRHLDGSRTNNLPRNLAWGTQRENADDRERHGRTARGERNGGGDRLTEDDVREIRARLVRGDKQTAIAADFGVSQSLISAIQTGRLWRHVQ